MRIKERTLQTNIENNEQKEINTILNNMKKNRRIRWIKSNEITSRKRNIN